MSESIPKFRTTRIIKEEEEVGKECVIVGKEKKQSKSNLKNEERKEGAY